MKLYDPSRVPILVEEKKTTQKQEEQSESSSEEIVESEKKTPKPQKVRKPKRVIRKIVEESESEPEEIVEYVVRKPKKKTVKVVTPKRVDTRRISDVEGFVERKPSRSKKTKKPVVEIPEESESESSFSESESVSEESEVQEDVEEELQPPKGRNLSSSKVMKKFLEKNRPVAKHK